MISQFTVEQFEFFVQPTRTRFPFRYGIASMTEVPHLFVRAQIIVNGSPATGLASEGLPPKWFTKNPATTFDQDLPEMLEQIHHASTAGTEIGRMPRTFFQFWQELHRAQSDWAVARKMAPLLANLGVSLIERAVLDALCRQCGRPLHALVRENQLGLRLSDIYAELAATEPKDWLPAIPSHTTLLRHTIGLTDALTPQDIAAGDRVDDGLPQDLEASIRAYGLRAFKIKLCGDPVRDRDRLIALTRIIKRETGGEFLATVDGDENFSSFEAFRTFWNELVGDPRVEPLRQNIVVVEQPVHRDHALSGGAANALSQWPDHPPLIIDESDGAIGDLPRALALGYDGTSHKNCKGIIKGIANACLLAQRRARGHKAILTGEDLCNLGPVALLQDLAMMSLLGIPHVERNGHHYFRGLSMWPAEWQNVAVHSHPDLYERSSDGLVRLHVANGELSLHSVNDAPFGLVPLLDPERANIQSLGAGVLHTNRQNESPSGY